MFGKGDGIAYLKIKKIDVKLIVCLILWFHNDG